MSLTEIDLHKQLKKYFGFSQFKGLQEDVVASIVHKNDTFVIMPTGGGKSLCYQLPALIEEGTAIVVSPLIALMKNQVDAIRGISSEYGVAHVLNSSLNKTEVKQVKEDIINGVTKLLYVAPESLTKEEASILQKAIDEAYKNGLIAFAIDFMDLAGNMDLAEDFLKYCIQYVLDTCPEDLAFLDKRLTDEEKNLPKEQKSEMGLIERLKFVVENDFERLTCTEAINILRNSKPNKKKK